MKDMFRDNNKRVWDVANRITFDRNRERKVYLEKSSKMLKCDMKKFDLEERRKFEEQFGWDL